MFAIRPFPPLINILSSHHYVLFERCWRGCLTAFLIGLIIGKPIIMLLKNASIRQVFRTRQQVRDLAILHDSKVGIPTMGGLITMISSVLAAAIWASFNEFVIISLVVYFFCSFIGWLDDFLKICRSDSRGLVSWMKLLLQTFVALFLVCFIFYNPSMNDLLMRVDWSWLSVKFTPDEIIKLIILFYIFIIIGTSNAVNLTDGIDGLAISNAILCFIFFGIVAFYSCNFSVATPNWLLTYSAGTSELAVLCSCFVGGSAAFLLFNHHPASVFMGDLGSLGLGGLIATIAILLRQPFMLAVVGFTFVVEALSVMLQVTSKRIFRKKIFLMAPIHHHFELKGFAEQKIVNTVFIFQFLLMLAALYVIFYENIKFN